tara:strand:- start:66 stop:341 length:276 start_codon:yes stop_codon:yes gene_type:complete
MEEVIDNKCLWLELKKGLREAGLHRCKVAVSEGRKRTWVEGQKPDKVLKELEEKYADHKKSEDQHKVEKVARIKKRRDHARSLGAVCKSPR